MKWSFLKIILNGMRILGTRLPVVSMLHNVTGSIIIVKDEKQ